MLYVCIYDKSEKTVMVVADNFNILSVLF